MNIFKSIMYNLMHTLSLTLKPDLNKFVSPELLHVGPFPSISGPNI